MIDYHIKINNIYLQNMRLIALIKNLKYYNDMVHVMKDPYRLVIKKFRNQAVKLDEIREYVEGNINTIPFIKERKTAEEIIAYLVRKRLAVRVVEDVYFIKDPFTDKSNLNILASGLNKAGIKWYLGLLSAYANGRMVQEGFSGFMIINNRYRGRRKLGDKKYGVNVYFVKTTQEEMFNFGIEEIESGIMISDPEKTVLDFIYFANYGTLPFFVAEEVVENYFNPDNSLMTARGRNYRRMKEYLNYYPDFVRNELYGKLREIYYYDPEIKEVFEI